MDEKVLWTVGELIEKLGEFPADMPVLYWDTEYPEFFSYISPEVQEVIDYDDGYYMPEPITWPRTLPEKRRFDAVILNGAVKEHTAEED